MKLKLSLLEKIKDIITAKELDFLIFTLRFQDNNGYIKGITKDETCKHLDIHKSTFYSIINSLEEKGFIEVDWNNKRHKFWSFKVIDNSFKNKSDYNNGYINLNTHFLYTQEFLNLTKSEKIICLKVLSVYRPERKKIPLKLETLMNWTGMSLQSAKKYALSIKSIFKKLVRDKNMIVIDLFGYDASLPLRRGIQTESEIYNEHELNYILAAKKVTANEKEKKDTLKLFNLFSEKHGRSTILTAILNCIDNHHQLIPQYINTMIRTITKDKLPIVNFI